MQGFAERSADRGRVVLRILLDEPHGIDAEQAALAHGIIATPLDNISRVVGEKDHAVDTDGSEHTRVNPGEPVVPFDDCVTIKDDKTLARSSLEPKSADKEILVLVNIYKSKLILRNPRIAYCEPSLFD